MFSKIAFLKAKAWQKHFCKADILKNFSKVKGNQLSQSIFSKKVASSTPVNLFKKKLLDGCLLMNFAKLLVKLILQNTSKRLKNRVCLVVI